MQKKANFIAPILCALALLVPSWVLAAKWRVPSDFATIQEAIDSPDVADGDTIAVSPGVYQGATITKKLVLHGEPGTVITGGPQPWDYKSFQAGFLFRGEQAENGSGTEIHHFKFDNVDFPIFASQWGAVVSEVKIHDCYIINAVQGITMWHADAWDVRRNTIHDLRAQGGGGIGILVGSYSGDDAFENVITENVIFGMINVHPEEKGGYNAAGIYLVSDHRPHKVQLKGGLVEGNVVTKNEVELESAAPQIVPVVAIELEDTRGDRYNYSITENEVQSNLIEAMEDLKRLIVTVPLTLSNPTNTIKQNTILLE